MNYVKIRLTGVIELETTIETEIDEEDFYNYIGDTINPEYAGDYVLKYLRDRSDYETEIWSAHPQDLTDYQVYNVMTADFVEAEVLDESLG